MKRIFTAALAVCAMGALALPGAAATIDMEGVAPTNSLSTENNTSRLFDGFFLNVPHGHFVDGGNTSYHTHPSDWLLADTNSAITVTKFGGATFTATSVDATVWHSSYVSSSTPAMTVTGTYAGGGSITQSFDIGAAFPFETFLFAGNWSGLSSLQFFGSGRAALDNIVLDGAPAVPVPASLPLLVAGFGAFAALRRRQKR